MIHKFGAFVFILLALFGADVFAQTNKTKTWDLTVLAGPLLPENITGINETFLTEGLRVSKGISYYRPEAFYLEAGGNVGKLRMAGLAIQNAFYVDDLNGIRPFWTLGFHGVEYQKYSVNGVGYSKGRSNGIHIGLGLDLPITKGFSVRHDLIWCNGPGRMMIVHLGLQWTFGGADDDKAEN